MAMAGWRHHASVQVEPLAPRVTAPRRGAGVDLVLRVPEALDPGARASAARDSVLHGCGPDSRQDRLLLRPAVRGTTAVVAGCEPAPVKQVRDPPTDRIEDGCHIAVRERCRLVKHGLTRRRPGKDTIEHQRVDVDIEVQRRSEALQHDHSSATAVRRTSLARTGAQKSEDGAEEDGDHGPAEVVVPGKQIPDAMRPTQYPLPHGHRREHLIHKVRRVFGHPASAAARAEPAPFARKRHQPIDAARGAAKTREPAGQPAAAQVRQELIIHDPGQPCPIPQARGVGPKNLNVIAHDLVQDALPRTARPVRDRRRSHPMESA